MNSVSWRIDQQVCLSSAVTTHIARFEVCFDCQSRFFIICYQDLRKSLLQESASRLHCLEQLHHDEREGLTDRQSVTNETGSRDGSQH
jgi:hypothetical protein